MKTWWDCVKRDTESAVMSHVDAQDSEGLFEAENQRGIQLTELY